MIGQNKNLEHYVSLYNSEIGVESKNILVKKIKEELKEETKKICAYFCNKYFKCDLDKKYYFSEFSAIANSTLLNVLSVYNNNKNKDLTPLYIVSLKNDLFDYIKKKDTKESMNTLYYIEDSKNNSYEEIDSDVDKILLRDKIVSIINRIKFKKDIHKEIFLELTGITHNYIWKTKEDYADIVGYSRMGINKLYNKYMKEFEDIINSSEKLQEELRQFL